MLNLSKYRKAIMPAALLVLLSLSGANAQDLVWRYHYGGPDCDWAQSIVETPDRGFIVTGITQSFGQGGADLWLIKIDRNGYLIWDKAYGGADWDYGYSIKRIESGGYIVAGNTRSFDRGVFDEIDYWLLRIDENGDTLWTRTFGDSADFEIANCVDVCADGGFLITGRFSPGDWAQFWINVFVVRTDSDGNLIWSGYYGSRENGKFNMGYSGLETIDSEYMIAGTFLDLSIENFSDILVLRLDRNGDSLWAFTYLNPQHMEEANSIIELDNMDYVIAGVSDRGRNADGLLMRLRYDGQVNWAKYFDRSDNDKFLNVNATSDDGLIATGSTAEGEMGNFLVAKYSSAGGLNWARYCTRQDYIDEGADILESADGHYIAAGNTRFFGDINMEICVVDIGGPESVEESEPSNSQVLIKAFPNPFNQSVRLTFYLEQKSPVNFTILNILGQEVITPIRGLLQSGEHSYTWDGHSSDGSLAASGVYYCRIVTDSSNMMVPIVLLR